MESTPLALIVVAAARDDSAHREAAATAAETLGASHRVEVLDLVAEGFGAAMSAAERLAYHDRDPIIDPMVGRHAELVQAAEVVVFVYPTAWWSPPPVLKAWLERVLVPGVAFVFDDRHHVRPNLGKLRVIVGITSYAQPRRLLRAGGDGGRHMLHRALRLNVPRRVRRIWVSGVPLAYQVRRKLESV